MNYLNIEQGSQEWWEFKVGKISGTRFGQLISSRDNGLIFEMADEVLNGHCEIDDFVSEDMEFGLENESTAIDLYERMSGIKFTRGGVIVSDHNDRHIASPDGVNLENGIICEVKCTRNGATQIKRFNKGPESSHMGQIANYFAMSQTVKEVHWISYCPFRPEREIVVHVFKRDDIHTEKPRKTFSETATAAAEFLPNFFNALDNLITDFKTIKF